MPDPDNVKANNKEMATQFLQMVVAGQIEEAYRKFVDLRGRHHNPFFPAGFPSLMQAMIQNHVEMPNKKITVRHVVGEGDLVVTRSHLVLTPGGSEMVAIHMFRFEAGKIVEMWDSGQELPAHSPNRDGAF